MQRDHYLPLKVIGEHLDAIDRGLEPPPIDAGGADRAEGGAGRRRPAERRSRSPAATTCGSRARSCSRSPRSPRTCSTSSSSTAWSRRAPAPATTTPTRWSIAKTARELADFGFEPRHLRAFKTAADREVGLVEQVVAPLQRGRDAAAEARAEEAVSEIAALSVRLHATLVKAGLRALLTASRRTPASARGVGW